MPENRVKLVLRAFALVAAVGIGGFLLADPEGFAAAPLDHLYRVLQLFFGEGDWTVDYELNALLEIARFLAPVVTIASLVFLFTEGLWALLVNLQVLRFKDHLIVVGVTGASVKLVQDCVGRKRSVAVLERDPSNALLAHIKALRVPLIVGDPLTDSAMRKLRLLRASRLISFLDSDDDNVELSLHLRQFWEQHGKPGQVLQVMLQIQDIQLAERLQDYPKFFDMPAGFEVHFYTVDDLAARALFRDFQPEIFADALDAEAVHIAILGYGRLGQHVLTTALRRGHYGNSQRLKVTVLSPHAEQEAAYFQQRCPAIGLAADVRFEPVELHAGALRASVDTLGLGSATLFVCCLEQDTDNLGLALALRSMALQQLVPDAPVMVSLRNSDGLSRLVESRAGGPEIPDGLLPFGTIEQIMQADRLFSADRDGLAMAMHRHFLEAQPELNPALASHRDWGGLPEVYRGYNRAQADHVSIKLRALGWCIDEAATAKVEFGPAQLHKLAEMEKRRWNAERASLGWEPDQNRSDVARQHPLLKAWRECTPQEQAYELQAVSELPDILRDEMGVGIAQVIFIGVTGHRAHRIAQHTEQLTEVVCAHIDEIRAAHAGKRFVVLSSLADGSDRLVADLIMRELGADLHAALPLPYEIYKNSFGTGGRENAASIEEFQALLGRAQIYFEMPLRFAGAGLLDRSDAQGEQARAQQYALAGAYIVSRCHELIAIWDGEPARGEGGTAEVVNWWQNNAIPTPYAFGNHYFDRREKKPARIVQLPV